MLIFPHSLPTIQGDNMKRILFLALTLTASSLFAADFLTFERVDVDPVFRSEGAAIADYNNDGKPDLGVGELYYAAPDWKPVPFNGKGYSEYQWQNYSIVFGAAAADVNKDGFVDFIRLPWPGKTQYWYANPGKDAANGVEWKEYKITDVLNNESPVALDMDGDGIVEIVGGWNPDVNNTNSPQRRVAIFKAGNDPTQPWTRIDVSELNHPAAGHYSHGFGIGDVNGDGRPDIVTPFGYFLQPKEGLTSGAKWEEVKADFGPECSHMQVADFDGDGKAEIFITSAHNFGIWMFKQNKDGGWASFDKNNNRQFLCHVPFADHNAMIDPSTTDITGRILEALGALGYRCSCREDATRNLQLATQIDRAIEFCRKEQLPDGSWFGRWGANYIYGTGEALNGLAAVGVDPKDPMVAAGVNWLKAHQHSDGGWGETLDSYRNPLLKGTGNSTASQTAWALLGLIASGEGASESVVNGIRYLIDHQDPDGQWSEPEFTGTGFPLVFYLRYHYYRNYFPLKALSDWESRFTQEQINALLASVETRNNADESYKDEANVSSDNSQPDDQASSLRRLVQGRFDNMDSARRFALIAAEASAAVTQPDTEEDEGISDSPRLKLYVG